MSRGNSHRFISASVARNSTGGFTVAVRYAYEGKPPSRKERVALARAVLGEALKRLEKSSEVADVGFQEDAMRRVRTDRMEV